MMDEVYKDKDFMGLLILAYQEYWDVRHEILAEKLKASLAQAHAMLKELKAGEQE